MSDEDFYGLISDLENVVPKDYYWLRYLFYRRLENE